MGFFFRKLSVGNPGLYRWDEPQSVSRICLLETRSVLANSIRVCVGYFVGGGLGGYCGSFWPGSSENVVWARAALHATRGSSLGVLVIPWRTARRTCASQEGQCVGEAGLSARYSRNLSPNFGHTTNFSRALRHAETPRRDRPQTGLKPQSPGKLTPSQSEKNKEGQYPRARFYPPQVSPFFAATGPKGPPKTASSGPPQTNLPGNTPAHRSDIRAAPGKANAPKP